MRFRCPRTIRTLVIKNTESANIALGVARTWLQRIFKEVFSGVFTLNLKSASIVRRYSTRHVKIEAPLRILFTVLVHALQRQPENSGPNGFVSNAVISLLIIHGVGQRNLLKRKFCSNECYAQSISVETAPKICEHCKKIYERNGQNTAWFEGSRFCSKDCQGFGTRGEKNHAYKKNVKYYRGVTVGKDVTWLSIGLLRKRL